MTHQTPATAAQVSARRSSPAARAALARRPLPLPPPFDLLAAVLLRPLPPAPPARPREPFPLLSAMSPVTEKTGRRRHRVPWHPRWPSLGQNESASCRERVRKKV